jgi:Tfp pilus assembly protein PilF
MPTKRKSKSPRQQERAHILYFMEDGSVSDAPGVPAKKTGRYSDKGLEDFPWPEPEDGVPCDEFGFPLPPEKADGEEGEEEEKAVQGAQPDDAEESAPDLATDDDVIEISSVSEISALPDDFDAQADGEEADGVLSSGRSESTQIESLSAPDPMDVGSMADEFEKALSEACSDDSAAKTLAEMPTVKPMPASDWTKHMEKFRVRSVSAQAPMFQAAKSLSGVASSGSGKASSKPAAHAASPWQDKPEKHDKQEKNEKHEAHDRHGKHEKQEKPADVDFQDAPTPPPDAPENAPENVQKGTQPSSASASAPSAVSAPPSSPSAVASPRAPAAFDGEMDASAICLLKSDAAKAHYRRRLKPMTEGTGARDERRSERASAALFGQELFAAGRPVPARKVFERIIAGGTAESFPFAMLGALHLAQGNDGEARKLFDQALRIDPDDVAALLGRAEIFIREAEPRAAMADVRRALGLAAFESSPLLGRAEAMKGVIEKLMRFLG